MKLVVVLLCVCFSGCASVPLPPHVWMPIEQVERVDLFWWTNEQVCQIRVLLWDRGTPKMFTVTVEAADQSLCLERLKADGYDVTGVTP